MLFIRIDACKYAIDGPVDLARAQKALRVVGQESAEVLDGTDVATGQVLFAGMRGLVHRDQDEEGTTAFAFVTETGYTISLSKSPVFTCEAVLSIDTVAARAVTRADLRGLAALFQRAAEELE